MTDDETEPSFETYLGSADVAFGARDAALLRAVEEHGSLNRAASELGRSYAHLQRRVVELESEFGSLVERSRGGASGGGSRLTDAARSLLARYDRLSAEFAGVAAVTENVLAGTVVDREGELATVDTDAGRLRALVPTDATAVELIVRSDALTLVAPSDVPAPSGTSARNRFSGTVVEVDAGQAVARVRVDAGLDAPLVALVTLTSVETLDLSAGDPVVATFKATATRGVPATR